MWTNENRARYDRSHLRYPSDLSDDEWKLVEPLIPPGKRGGDKRSVIMREVVNGLMYILSTGCQLTRRRLCTSLTTTRRSF
jgi:transposase